MSNKNELRKMENEYLIVEIADHGAELSRIYDKKEEREVLWDANPKFWKRHAPILFPNVGKHYLNQYRYEGKTYHTSQHGFARDCEFTLKEQTENKIVHVLTSNPETLKNYPFLFKLEVTHSLCKNTITVEWKVTNTGEKTMYFTIGGHPAFRVPVLENTVQTDYYLKFENKDSVTYRLLDTETGTAMQDQTCELSLNDGFYQVTSDLFDKDALIFDDYTVTKASICLPDKTPYITLDSKDFPNYGIWAAKGAPFICLEPWFGRCDNFGFTGEMSEKPGIQTAAPGQEWSASYHISVNDSF